MKFLWLLLSVSVLAGAQYSVSRDAEGDVTIARLKDASRQMEVAVVPAYGNRAVEFLVHGHNIIYFPYASIPDFLKHPDLNGIPFLGPWANRMDGTQYWANGAEFELNPALHNYQTDNNGLPIHGLLTHSDLWEITALKADADGAEVTSRLEFWKHPDLMEQWPFAQSYEMTYRLSNGVLEVRTSIINQSTAAIPVAIGFHPYYRIPGKPRDEWTAHIPATQAIVTDKRLIPTGEFTDAALPESMPLAHKTLDNGYTGLQRDRSGQAHFAIQSGDSKIEISFGPKFPVVVLWEPPAWHGPQSEFFCIEPMTGPTNVINLAHAGKYHDLQTVAPGATWTESFWIKPSGI